MQSSMQSVREQIHDEDAYELKDYRKRMKESKSYGDATSDDGEDVSNRVRPSSESSAASDGSVGPYTAEEEKRIKRKLDLHVVLSMSFLYMLSFLDRSNIGNAKIAGLTRDLRLTDDQFEWLLTAFYITYIAFEWMILLYHILSPHVYISICVFSWGIIASLQSLTTTFSQMLTLRLLLGISEAAFSPGVPYYLSFFYRREELALRAGIQISAAPLAASFAGSLAWVITKLGESSPLAPWRLLFLAEGFPSVLVAVIAWQIVPDRPETATFLSERERKIAKVRLVSLQSVKSSNEALTAQVRGKRVDWKQIWHTIKDPKCYLTALMFLNCNIAFSSMPVFLPSVINEMGYSARTSQALSAPPFLLAFVVVLLTASLSDRTRTRSLFIIFHALLASLSYLLISLGGHLNWPHTLRYLLIYPACAGFFSAITIIITWTMNNQQSETGKGVGMTILNVVGQCGPLVGTRLYPDKEGPGYVRGMGICGVAMGVVVVLAGMLRVVLGAENQRRKREWDLADALGDEEEESGEEAEPLAGGDEGHSGAARHRKQRGKEERFVMML